MGGELRTRWRVFPGWHWVAVALVIPIAGLIGGAVSGPVDAPLPALIGGVVTGAGLGAVQWLVARDTFGDGWIWISTSALAYGFGLVAGAAVVGYETDLGSLAAMGAISGVVLGLGQGIALTQQGHRELGLAWAAASSAFGPMTAIDLRSFRRGSALFSFLSITIDLRAAPRARVDDVPLNRSPKRGYGRKARCLADRTFPDESALRKVVLVRDQSRLLKSNLALQR